MTRVNLIPRERLRQRHRTVRARRWMTGAAAYALFLLVATIVSRAVRAGDDRSLHEGLDEARQATSGAVEDVNLLNAEIRATTAALAANRTVGDQPDWSILLAALAEATGEEVVLRACRMGPSGAARRSAENAAIEAAVTVELIGLAETQRDVSDLLLRIEDVSVFRDVRLHDTHREPFMGAQAIGFRLEFTIDPAPETQP